VLKAVETKLYLVVDIMINSIQPTLASSHEVQVTRNRAVGHFSAHVHA
jgi:hypothetical protein